MIGSSGKLIIIFISSNPNGINKHNYENYFYIDGLKLRLNPIAHPIENGTLFTHQVAIVCHLV